MKIPLSLKRTLGYFTLTLQFGGFLFKSSKEGRWRRVEMRWVNTQTHTQWTGLWPRRLFQFFLLPSSFHPYVLQPAAQWGHASIFNTAHPSWHFISLSKATEEEEVDRERSENFDVYLQRNKTHPKEWECLWRQRCADREQHFSPHCGFQSEVPEPPGGSPRIAAGVSVVMGRGDRLFSLKSHPLVSLHRREGYFKVSVCEFV